MSALVLVKIFFNAVMVLANGQVMQHKTEVPSMEECLSQVHDFVNALPVETKTTTRAIATGCVIEYQGEPS